jgi:hypothetical protein
MITDLFASLAASLKTKKKNVMFGLLKVQCSQAEKVAVLQHTTIPWITKSSKILL